jgi:uncharacterized protein YoxC
MENDNQDLKKIFQKLNQLSKKVDDNTKIVKDLRSHNRWAFFFKILYYAFLIAMAFGAWYFIQPVIESVTQTIDGISKTGNDISSSLDGFKKAGESIGDVKSLLDKFKK